MAESSRRQSQAALRLFDPDYTVVYECTLQARSVKSRFLRTHKSSIYRYDKAILYPRNQSNGPKICTQPGQMSGVG